MISVVDYATQPSGDAAMVIWTVQPRIDVATDILSGAWILGPAEAHPYSTAAQILAGTTVIVLDAAAEAHIPEAVARTTTTAIAEAMRKARAEYSAAAQQAQQEAQAAKRSFSLPRFPEVHLASSESFIEGYHGEAVAQRAWLEAQVLVDLVQQWRAIETVRRGRKALKERFGADPLPVPVPTVAADTN